MTTKTRTTRKPRAPKGSTAPAQAPVQDKLNPASREALAKLSADNPSLGAIQDKKDEGGEPEQFDVGEDAFDIINSFGTNSQRVCWKAIANSALATALYAANSAYGMQEREMEGEDVNSDTLLAAQYRVSLYSDLYFFARGECLALKDTKYDMPMEPDGMFDLLVSGEAQPRETDTAIFEATLKAMGVSEAEANAIRSARQANLLKQAKKNQATMKERRAEVLDEVNRGDARFVPTQFNATQHLRFFQKVHQKLRAAASRALGYIGQYDDAAVDALQYSNDATRVDKAMVAFRKRNRDDLVQFEDRSAE